MISFKNTDELVEDKKQILKTDPDAIIKKQEKDECIEKLSNIISEKIIDRKDMIDIKKLVIKQSLILKMIIYITLKIQIF